MKGKRAPAAGIRQSAMGAVIAKRMRGYTLLACFIGLMNVIEGDKVKWSTDLNSSARIF
ncbi:hypothetical protein [Paenibacillus typhae]|uniref:hypothetical protein n=1 Tax=Paenibacillus typhae TaxID=1174501 RepID=UPI001C8D5030|nr:hypothetical protein [Paenibacillus typhae]